MFRKDLAPTLDDDLEIECQPAVDVFGHQPLVKETEDGLPSHLYAEYVVRGGKWTMLHSNYEVKASSTLAPEGEYSYDAENVRDLGEESAWSAGAEGSGVGEWLELVPVAPKPLVDIRDHAGYQKIWMRSCGWCWWTSTRMPRRRSGRRKCASR